VGFRILALLIALAGIAAADPPTGYKCGPGGRVLKDRGCACPKNKIDSRDATGKAICAPKPPPVATACLKDRTGKHAVTIDSQPSGAVFYLGDKACGAVGTTPWTGKLAAGPMTVIFERHSYVPATRTFDVLAKPKQAFSVALARTNVGTVNVLADADPNVKDAEVFIDDVAVGKAPLAVKVAGGRRKLELRRDGFTSFVQWLEVEDAVSINVLPMLTRPVVVSGKLFVDADVPGAEVTVNGTRRGTTPIVIDNLPAGSYTVEVAKPPAAPFKTTIQIGKGDHSVRAALAASVPAKPTTSKLTVAPRVPAEVFLDGESVGFAPFERQLSPAWYWIQVRAKGYVVWEARIRMEVGKDARFTPDLEPAAVLTITSTPAGADVFIDGKRMGITPQVLELAVRSHKIIVEKAGFQRYTQTIDLKADKALDVSLKR
jgi:hypothetical protein